MKARISTKDIFIFLLLLLEYRFFFLIPIPSFISKTNTYHNKLLEVFLVLLMLFYFNRYRKSEFKYTKEILLILLLITLNMIYCFYRYPNADASEIIVPFIAYLLLLLYYPLSEYFKNGRGLKKFIRMIRGMNIVGCSIIIIQALIFNKYGYLFLHIYEIQRSENVSLRDGLMRITYFSTIVSIALLFSFVELLVYKRKRLLNVANIVLGAIYFLYVSQTRMYILVMSLTALYTFYFLNVKKKNRGLTICLATTILLTAFWALDIKGYFVELIRPLFTGDYIYNGSYYARFESYRYFFKMLKNHPFFGLGILKPQSSSPYYYIIHGNRGIAYYTDVGLFGTTAEFGFPLFAVFIYLLYKVRTKFKEQINNQYNSYIKSFWIFILLSCGSLSVLDPQRVIVLAIALAIFNSYTPDEKENYIYDIHCNGNL